MTPKIGQRIITDLHDVPDTVGTVISGPVWKNGKAVFKVRIVDPQDGEYDIWLWPEHMKPLMQML